MKKVFISTTTFAEYEKKPLCLLENDGIQYELNPYKRKLTESEIMEIMEEGAYSGLIAGTEPLTGKVFEKAPSLKVISRVGVGLDGVDVSAAKEHGIAIYNTPSVLVDSVAELTIGLILCCLRKIASMDRNVRKGVWKKEMGLLFKGKTLGIIGFGKIGSKVSQIAEAFGVKVVFHDIGPAESKFCKKVSFEELITESDIISIHLSSKEQLISEMEVRKMKDGVILVNTSRGGVIDEDALHKGLLSGKIACAGLDVYKEEPYSGNLTELDNVVLTPHVGSYAKEARIAMEIEATMNLIKGFAGEKG